MEVKINREIRNYTESMFFGLSMRQFVFFCLGDPRCRGAVLSAETPLRDGNCQLDVFSVPHPLRRWALSLTTV